MEKSSIINLVITLYGIMSNEKKIKRAEKREERKQSRETKRKFLNGIWVFVKWMTGRL